MSKETRQIAAFLRGAERASKEWKGGVSLDTIEKALWHLSHGTDEERAEYGGVLAHGCHRGGLERSIGLDRHLSAHGVTRGAFLEVLGKAGGHVE